MKNWEKILFWVLTVIIIIDNISWQWLFKLTTTTEPPIPPLGGVFGSMASDILILVVWLWFLIKIYKKAIHKD